MNPRSGLVPNVINAAAASTPAVNVVPRYTYAGTIRELETLGIIFETSGHTPNAIKLVAKYDHEMLHRIMTAIRNTEKPFRGIWTITLGLMMPKDVSEPPRPYGRGFCTSTTLETVTPLQRLPHPKW